MLKQNRNFGWRLPMLLILLMVLAACSGEGEGEAETEGAQMPPTAIEQAQPAAEDETAAEAMPTAAEATEVLTETEAAAETTGVTDTAETEDSELTTQDVTVITGTQLITSTQITTDVIVSTETVIIEQQLVTSVITATDLVTNVRVATDEATTTDTELITDTAEMTMEKETGAAVITDTTTMTGAGFIGVEGAGQNLIPASTLLDYDFENVDGEVSGEIEDLVIDTANGQVLYATLEYGGLLDIGATTLPVPLSAFTWGPEGNLVLNFEEEQLQEFPDLEEDWPDVSDPTWDDEVVGFWNGVGVESSFDVGEASTSIMRVSQLMDYPVSDVGYGEGAVEDLIIDLGEGRARYVMVSFGDAFENELVAVPFSAFVPGVSSEVFTFAEGIDQSILEGAPRADATPFGTTGPIKVTIMDSADAYWEEIGYWVTAPKPE